ncbi:Restriction endonuclease [Devosia equisanguinis]|uniref:Restriction endonuclease n=2 Tax=Devosia equisanguinis TaxID=2490941 RepID=A0A3S4EKC9_9HYPH|nr:Restriction endonuclease [Devosia equisanguinis]
MSYASEGKEHWCVFPNRKSAMGAASIACRNDIGGYLNVSIRPIVSDVQPDQVYASATDWLFDSQISESSEAPASPVNKVVRKLMHELVTTLAEFPDELASVEWRDLERLLGVVFERLEFDVTVTRSAKDGGFDIVLKADGQTYLVEVKHWAQPNRVGPGVLRKFTDVAVSHGAQGLLISSSGFTSTLLRGRIELTQLPVLLGDATKIISLCRCYVQSERGVWRREKTASELLFAGAF